MNRQKKNCCACSLQPGDTAHIVTGRREIREDVNTLRNEVSELRKEVTCLTGRVRRIEGFLEMTNS